MRLCNWYLRIRGAQTLGGRGSEHSVTASVPVSDKEEILVP